MSLELFEKISRFNLEMHNKINQVRLYLNNLNSQLELRDTEAFPKHNEIFKKYIQEEITFYEKKLNQLCDLYINLNYSRYI